MKDMKTTLICIFCTFIIGCTNKPKQEETSQASANDTVGINDTLGLSKTVMVSPASPDIPAEEAINPDSLTVKTEYDYYPLSTTEIKITITNHSHHEYECGEDYRLAYYNNTKHQWNTLTTNPITNPILWTFPPQHSIHKQTIKLSTGEMPRHAGKYRIYKSFNRKTKVAYAEFELVDKKGVERLRKRIDDCWGNDEKSVTAKNIYMTYTQNGDTIFVALRNNAPRFQEKFKREVISYSAVNYGKVQQPTPFLHSAFLDTLQINMKTEKPVYPAGTESVKVTLTNNNPQTLFFGEYYSVARKSGRQWILLNGGGVWNDVGIIMQPKQTHEFTANLYPLFNDNKPGIYRVYKEIGFYNSSPKWYMAAEFRIE